jgi:hypothetical protein
VGALEDDVHFTAMTERCKRVNPTGGESRAIWKTVSGVVLLPEY